MESWVMWIVMGLLITFSFFCILFGAKKDKERRKLKEERLQKQEARLQAREDRLQRKEEDNA